LYYYWQSEGISASGKYREEDNYIRVRKRFYDRFGNPLAGNTFKQNELIIVGISLENAYTTEVDNIVITDVLPAGFEICLLYTSDAADERSSVDLGGRRI